MKKKLIKKITVFFAIILCMASFVVAIGFDNKAVAATNSAEDVEWIWEVYKHGDISLEEAFAYIDYARTTVYENGQVGLLPASELEKAINNGCFVDYIDYFKAQSYISQDFVYTPTSTSSGSTGGTSTKKEYTEEEIAAAWKETSRTDATCLEAGVINYKNSLTGETKTEEIKALGHNYEVVTEVAATCEETGVDVYTCLACGDTYEQQTPALGHSFTVTSKTDATCTVAGTVVSVCDTCEMEKSEVIEALGHTEGAATIVKEATLFIPGEEAVSCTVCDARLSTTVIPATCPIPLGVIITVIVFAVAGVMVIVRKKKSK